MLKIKGNIIGIPTFEINNFKYENARYVPNKDYEMVFSAAHRNIGKIRQPVLPPFWTKYRRNCTICRIDTECYCVALYFLKDSQTMYQTLYLDYCINCSNFLNLIEEDTTKSQDLSGLFVLELSMNHVVPTESIPKKMNLNELNKLRFETLLKKFTHKSSWVLSSKTVSNIIEELASGKYHWI